jgi:hypothetical protein
MAAARDPINFRQKKRGNRLEARPGKYSAKEPAN